MSLIMDLCEQSNHILVFITETQSVSSKKDISNIGSSLAGVSVKAKEGVELSNGFCAKDRVFSSNILGEDSFELFFLSFFLCHDKS